MRKSQIMIQIILSTLHDQLSRIKWVSNKIISISKERRISKQNKKFVDEYGNIELREFDINDFTEIIKSCLYILGDENEILPLPAFNISEVCAILKNKAGGEQILKSIRELQWSNEALENDLRSFKGKLESYIGIFSSAGIIDRGVLIENRNKEIKNILLQIPQQSNNLKNALMPETSVEEMISTKENGNRFKADLFDIYLSCKSLLDILKQLKDECKLSTNAFRALKATFDKQYIFFCN